MRDLSGFGGVLRIRFILGMTLAYARSDLAMCRLSPAFGAASATLDWVSNRLGARLGLSVTSADSNL